MVTLKIPHVGVVMRNLPETNLSRKIQGLDLAENIIDRTHGAVLCIMDTVEDKADSATLR